MIFVAVFPKLFFDEWNNCLKILADCSRVGNNLIQLGFGGFTSKIFGGQV